MFPQTAHFMARIHCLGGAEHLCLIFIFLDFYPIIMERVNRNGTSRRF
jgi:hypothetical protein